MELEEQASDLPLAHITFVFCTILRTILYTLHTIYYILQPPHSHFPSTCTRRWHDEWHCSEQTRVTARTLAPGKFAWGRGLGMSFVSPCVLEGAFISATDKAGSLGEGFAGWLWLSGRPQIPTKLKTLPRARFLKRKPKMTSSQNEL